MKKSYEEIIAFVKAGAGYQKRVAGENKLTYANGRVIKSLQKKAAACEEEYHIKVQDADIEYASVYPPDYPEAHKRGNLIIEAGSYQYTRENEKKRFDAHRTAKRQMLETEIEFEPYYATEIPQDLTQAERDAFTGYVLREEPEDATASASTA